MEYSELFDKELKNFIDSIKPAIKKIVKKSFPYLYNNSKENPYYTEEDLLQEGYMFAIEAFKKFDCTAGSNVTGWALCYIENSFRNMKKEFFQLNSSHISIDDIEYGQKYENSADDIFENFLHFIDDEDKKEDEDEYKLSDMQISYIEKLKEKINNKSVSAYLSLITENNGSLIKGINVPVQLGISKSRVSQIRGQILRFVNAEEIDEEKEHCFEKNNISSKFY